MPSSTSPEVLTGFEPIAGCMHTAAVDLSLVRCRGRRRTRNLREAWRSTGLIHPLSGYIKTSDVTRTSTPILFASAQGHAFRSFFFFFPSLTGHSPICLTIRTGRLRRCGFYTSVELMLWPTVNRPIRLGVGHPFGAHDQIFIFPFFCRTIALIFILGHPLWREDGSVICSAICQWSESRRPHNHTLLSHLRLLGSLSVASYDSQGLRWKYSYPPPHGDAARGFNYLHLNVGAMGSNPVPRMYVFVCLLCFCCPLYM
jgi:hypothetical protein